MEMEKEPSIANHDLTSRILQMLQAINSVADNLQIVADNQGDLHCCFLDLQKALQKIHTAVAENKVSHDRLVSWVGEAARPRDELRVEEISLKTEKVDGQQLATTSCGSTANAARVGVRPQGHREADRRKPT